LYNIKEKKKKRDEEWYILLKWIRSAWPDSVDGDASVPSAAAIRL